MAAIFFDVDGTVVQFPGEYGEIIATAYETVLGRVEQPWIEAYNRGFFEYFGAFADDPYREAFADACADHSLDADPDALADALVTAEFEAVEPVAGVTDLVPALAERHTLGLLTNGIPEVQFGKVDELGLLDQFDVRVASHQSAIEATKPDAAIYDAARGQVENRPCVMVGDDYEPDVAGARDSGFVPVHVDEEATELGVPDFEALATLL